jgi:hypothetical protein
MIQSMVDEKTVPDQGGEDSDEPAERTREVSMPDGHYQSLLLGSFLSGLDEFAEEQKNSAGKAGGTSGNSSPTKIAGAKPGMQPWQTI